MLIYRDGCLFKPGSDKQVGYFEKSNGYWRHTYKGKKQYNHRVIWWMHYGDIPSGMQVDHINQDRTDNRIENLRLVTHQENNRNKGLNKNSTSGYLGVSWSKAYSRWVAHITVDRKSIFLGYFHDIDKAVLARKAADIEYGFTELHGS